MQQEVNVSEHDCQDGMEMVMAMEIEMVLEMEKVREMEMVMVNRDLRIVWWCSSL